MGFIMPEIALQRVIQVGIKHLRDNEKAFNEIFSMFLDPEMVNDYGQEHIDKIRNWFKSVKVPVIQGNSVATDRIPCFSITLSSENEDESKAAIGDHFGDEPNNTVGLGVTNVIVSIGIHADKASEYVLWLYYILSYIFLKEKRMSERLGLQIHTWSASDYNRDVNKESDFIWTRWVTFKCTTQNAWVDEVKTTTEDVDLKVRLGRIGDGEDEDLV